MNLRKRPPASDNQKVMNLCLDKHLKHWPVNVRRKRTVKLPLKSIDKNPGWCIKESATGWVEVAKPLDDNDRKMQFSEAIYSTFEFQSKNSGARPKEINEGSCKTKRVRYTLPNDSLIKSVNPSSNKYPNHLRTGGALCPKEDLAKFAKWPENIRKKRSSSGLNQGSVRPGKCQKGAREKFGTSSTHFLPDEVVEGILSRLPVKSLARFRCVCKPWHHHLSYSERFISLHVDNYKTSELLVGACWVAALKCSMYFLPPPPPTGGYCDKDGASSQEIAKHEFPKLLGGSCNGIVCLYDRYSFQGIVLWNPATNESKKIPSSCDLINGYSSFCTVGFGFDPMTNDYKILKMVYGKLKPPVAQLELYSLRKGSWKIVDSHDFLVVQNYDCADVACSLPFTNNRIVCAVVSPLSAASKWEILLFDMSSETYEIIPVPPSLDAQLGGYHPSGIISYTYRERCFKLFPFKETIALGIVHCVRNRSYCDVWVLNDFSPTRSRCWSKLLSTNMNDGHTVPVGCWGSSQIFFQQISSRRLFCLDLGGNMMVELGVVPPEFVTTTIYKESLVRINNINEDEDSKCFS